MNKRESRTTKFTKSVGSEIVIRNVARRLMAGESVDGFDGRTVRAARTRLAAGWVPPLSAERKEELGFSTDAPENVVHDFTIDATGRPA